MKRRARSPILLASAAAMVALSTVVIGAAPPGGAAKTKGTAPAKGQAAAKSGNPDSSKDADAIPDTFLIGAYDRSYSDVTRDETSRRLILVFAGRFKGNLESIKAASEDHLAIAVYSSAFGGTAWPTARFRLEKIAEAVKVVAGSRAVEANHISLTPRGVIGRELVRGNEALVIGVDCPVCQEYHWIMLGCKSDTDRTFYVLTDGEPKDDPASIRKGWQSYKLDSSRSLWYLPLAGGGYHSETFACRPPAGGAAVPAPLPAVPDRFLELRVGVTPEGDFAFAYRVLGCTTVSLVGDYGDKRTSPSRAESPSAIYDEQIQYYSAFIADDPAGPAMPDARRFDNIVADVAEFARETVRKAGITLGDRSTLKRQRLTPDKVLVLGTYNASSDDNQWLAIRRDTSGKFLMYRGTNRGYASKDVSPVYTWQTGGREIEVRVGTRVTGDVEYYFFPPR